MKFSIVPLERDIKKVDSRQGGVYVRSEKRNEAGRKRITEKQFCSSKKNVEIDNVNNSIPVSEWKASKR